MAKNKIIGLCGSLRKDSWNLKLLRHFLAEAEKAGFEAKAFDGLEMPLVNEDLEKSPLDARILRFREALESAEIVAIASPEYNGSYSPALKNAIDWATRPPANLWAGKIVVLLGASPGAFGGIRGGIHLRTLLGTIKAWVLPEQVLLPLADQAFDPEGKLTNESAKKQVKAALESLGKFAGKML
jgi:NAD(P)H-dependent FMN reductase